MSEDKQIVELDEQLLEDLLYMSCVRAMQLEFSSPKFTVVGNVERNRFEIHCVFPFAGETGSIIDINFDCKRFHKKSLEVLMVELTKLQEEIIEKVHDQIDRVSEYRRRKDEE